MGNEKSTNIFDIVSSVPDNAFVVLGFDKGVSKKTNQPYLNIYCGVKPYSKDGFGIRTTDNIFVSPKYCARFNEVVENLRIGQYCMASYFINGNFNAVSDIQILK